MSTVDPWTRDPAALAAAWQPGCPVEVVDEREIRPGEAWVCLRAGDRECVVGLRRRPDGDRTRVDLLYAYPCPMTVPTTPTDDRTPP